MIFKQIYFIIDGILSSTTTPGQSGPGSNNNEKLLHTFQSPWLNAV